MLPIQYIHTPAGSHMTLMKVKADVTGPWLSDNIYYIPQISKVSQILTTLKDNKLKSSTQFFRDRI